MKFKLDENLDPRLVLLFKQHLHEAETVLSEGKLGIGDDGLFDLCRAEGRVLVTLDLDFSDPLRFPLDHDFGLVILRPRRTSPAVIEGVLERAIPVMSESNLLGRKWIIESARVRIYEPETTA